MSCFRKPITIYRILVGVATVVFVASSSASAFFLTDDDYAYLATQNFVRSESIFQNLGPRKEARLHALINEVQTKNALAIRAKIFTAALKEFASSTLGGNAPGLSSGSIPGGSTLARLAQFCWQFFLLIPMCGS